jgi:hypothetical protein
MLQTVEQPNASEPVTVVSRLITELGVARLIGLVADITHEEADRLLMAGDRQNAARHMRDFRIVQRAAEPLRDVAVVGSCSR